MKNVIFSTPKLKTSQWKYNILIRYAYFAILPGGRAEIKVKERVKITIFIIFFTHILKTIF